MRESRLAEALEPFAHIGDRHGEFGDEQIVRLVYDDPVWGDNTVIAELFMRPFRKAIAALSAYREEAREPVDMRKVVEALGFEPDNHHNALKCPYCTPQPPTQEGGWRSEAAREAFRAGWYVNAAVGEHEAEYLANCESADWLEHLAGRDHNLLLPPAPQPKEGR